MNIQSQHTSIGMLLKNIGITVISSVVFALALRVGYQAEQGTSAAHQPAR